MTIFEIFYSEKLLIDGFKCYIVMLVGLAAEVEDKIRKGLQKVLMNMLYHF